MLSQLQLIDPFISKLPILDLKWLGAWGRRNCSGWVSHSSRGWVSVKEMLLRTRIRNALSKWGYAAADVETLFVSRFFWIFFTNPMWKMRCNELKKVHLVLMVSQKDVGQRLHSFPFHSYLEAREVVLSSLPPAVTPTINPFKVWEIFVEVNLTWVRRMVKSCQTYPRIGSYITASSIISLKSLQLAFREIDTKWFATS